MSVSIRSSNFRNCGNESFYIKFTFRPSARFCTLLFARGVEQLKNEIKKKRNKTVSSYVSVSFFFFLFVRFTSAVSQCVRLIGGCGVHFGSCLVRFYWIFRAVFNDAVGRSLRTLLRRLVRRKHTRFLELVASGQPNAKHNAPQRRSASSLLVLSLASSFGEKMFPRFR